MPHTESQPDTCSHSKILFGNPDVPEGTEKRGNNNKNQTNKTKACTAARRNVERKASAV